MKFTLSTTLPDPKTTACLILPVYENAQLSTCGTLLDKSLKGRLSKALTRLSFTGNLYETLPLFQLDDNCPPMLMIGCGKEGAVNPGTFRKLVAQAVRSALSFHMKEITFCLTEISLSNELMHTWKVKQIVEMTHECCYRFDKFKSEKSPTLTLENISIYVPDTEQEKACVKALQQGLSISKGVSLTKNLANLPSSVCTPTYLAAQAASLAAEYANISLTQLNEKAMQELGMGALLGVSQGSEEEGILICLNYQGGKKNQAPIVFVGKGVTFDTGGISLKPADSMVGMKYDMCGAATVLGVILAAAELKLPLNIIGLIPAVENMPDGKAYKPEDILTSLSGQTIEVISTDAEGRLILADALTYAERFKPDVVIDIATLTGAVVIALGHHVTGLISNHGPLSEDLIAAGNECYDRVWPLPMFDEYQDQIKSPFADMANTGGRSAGTITAGCFLSRFTKNFHWAHLDVAGTAAMMSGTQERNATGRPVPLLVQYLLNRVAPQ